MIIDCHGHYTTAPKPLKDWRQRQIDSLKDSAPTPKAPPVISDDEIRESLQGAQLQSMRDRGVDFTIFSPIAGQMGHHIGNRNTSETWSAICNELIHRVCTMHPDKFVGVCQLPQSPGVAPANCIPELERCVNEYGFIGCNLNPDPSGGYWTDPPLKELLLKNVYFDTCVYHKPGFNFDDTKRYIDSIDGLSAGDREKIFNGNVRRVYSRYGKQAALDSV